MTIGFQLNVVVLNAHSKTSFVVIARPAVVGLTGIRGDTDISE